MKQQHPHGCVACVIGEIIGKSEQETIDWFGYSPPYNVIDLSLCLVHHGVFPGVEYEWYDGLYLSEKRMEFSVAFGKMKVIFAVESERYEGKQHLIYWDGDKVIDSNPDSPDGRDLNSYKIITFMPLMFTQQRLDGFSG